MTSKNNNNNNIKMEKLNTSPKNNTGKDMNNNIHTKNNSNTNNKKKNNNSNNNINNNKTDSNGKDSIENDPLTQSTAETWLSIASLAETVGDTDRAALAYDATLQYNPNSTKALTSLAHLYRSRDIFQKAAELFERALQINPELSDVWATLGHCYLMLDDLQRAYNAYQQALYHLSNPNVPKLWHGIGILYDRYGSLDYAEEAFAKVLELDPHFEKANEIYFRLGIIYKHRGKWSQALECFRYILQQPPAPLQEWDIWFQLGSVLESMGEWQGAREAYEHVLLQNEHHAKVLQQLGCLYGMNNVQFYDPQKALNYLLKSLEVDPSDATTWYHLGRVHMIRSDYTAAYDAFQQAVNRDSRNPIFWCSIGVLYYQISQYRDALDAYTRAIRLNPYISEVWYDLGTLYETCNNQLTDALDAYKQAARLDPENIHIRKRLEALTQQLSNPNASQAIQQQQQQQQQQLPPPPPPQVALQQQLQDPQQQQQQPVMLQPTLQQNDQTNPLNVRPAVATMYSSGPLSQNQQGAQPLQQPQPIQHQPQQLPVVPQFQQYTQPPIISVPMQQQQQQASNTQSVASPPAKLVPIAGEPTQQPVSQVNTGNIQTDSVQTTANVAPSVIPMKTQEQTKVAASPLVNPVNDTKSPKQVISNLVTLPQPTVSSSISSPALAKNDNMPATKQEQVVPQKRSIDAVRGSSNIDTLVNAAVSSSNEEERPAYHQNTVSSLMNNDIVKEPETKLKKTKQAESDQDKIQKKEESVEPQVVAKPDTTTKIDSSSSSIQVATQQPASVVNLTESVNTTSSVPVKENKTEQTPMSTGEVPQPIEHTENENLGKPVPPEKESEKPAETGTTEYKVESTEPFQNGNSTLVTSQQRPSEENKEPPTESENKVVAEERKEEETVIKPTAEAIEKLQEEAKLREEEKLEQEGKSSADTSAVSGKGSFTEANTTKENVVRQVEEDENYDE